MVMALSAANATARRFRIAISAVMFPPSQGGAPGDLAASFRAETLGARAPTLLATQLSECDCRRVLTRIGTLGLLGNLACGKIDNKLRQLVCVARTLA